jgi:cytochrome P450
VRTRYRLHQLVVRGQGLTEPGNGESAFSPFPAPGPHRLSERITFLDDGEDALTAMADFEDYMGGLAAAKRENPGHDVISDLVAAQVLW